MPRCCEKWRFPHPNGPRVKEIKWKNTPTRLVWHLKTAYKAREDPNKHSVALYIISQDAINNFILIKCKTKQKKARTRDKLKYPTRNVYDRRLEKCIAIQLHNLGVQRERKKMIRNQNLTETQCKVTMKKKKNPNSYKTSEYCVFRLHNLTWFHTEINRRTRRVLDECTENRSVNFELITRSLTYAHDIGLKKPKRNSSRTE